MKHSVKSLVFMFSLVLLTHPVQAEEDVRVLLKQLTTQVKELQTQLKQSNARIQELEKQQSLSQTKSTETKKSELNAVNTNTSAGSGNTGTVFAASTASQSVETVKPEKPAVTAGDVKGSFKIPGTDTSVGFGGFVKADAIYSSVSAGANKQGDQQTIYSQIPLEKSPGEHSQLIFHAKESRLWFRTFTPSAWGDINTFLEMDFFGDSNPYTYTPRLRHAYGSIGNFLVGQTWTTFLNNSVLPDLLDQGGSAGALTSLRQPQIRWTQPFTVAETPMELQLAVETPRTRLRDNPTADADAFATPNSERYPDIVARLNFNPDWGNISLAGMARQIRTTSSATGRSEDAWGGAVSVAGKINTVEQDNLRFMLNYGNVLGRYAATNTFEDAALTPQGNLSLLKVFAAMFSYQHFWSKDWRSTVAYGFAHADQPDYVGGNMTQEVQSLHANLLWSPVSQTIFGLEYIFMHRTSQDLRDGDVHRLQFSARYNF